MGEISEYEELMLIKKLDDLFPYEVEISAEWGNHWPKLIDFIIADRQAQKQKWVEEVEARAPEDDNYNGGEPEVDRKARIDERKRMSYHIDRLGHYLDKDDILHTFEAMRDEYIQEIVDPHKRRVAKLQEGK